MGFPSSSPFPHTQKNILKRSKESDDLDTRAVEALQEVATQLGKQDWNFKVDPCSNDTSWVTPISKDRPLYNNSVVCNCSDPQGECHVVSIFLKGQDLAGVLPRAIVKLPYLKNLDLTRNYLVVYIPSEWASTKLELLRISDLHGGGSGFPRLENMTNIELLMLRSCNISGPIPLHVAAMTKLKILDLSFNRLVGNLSTNLEGLTSMENVYLTSNLLSGPIPDWIKNGDTRAEIDLSRNNFTESTLPTTCRDRLNLFKSSSGANNSKVADECLKSYACSKDRYSLHINCGGGATTVGSITYEADEESGAAAKYVPIKEGWEISNTGHFWDKSRSSSDYIAQNLSILNMKNSEVYTRARLSPLSLTYYVRCLGNGNYNVKLHFAEIVMRDNRSFYGLGSRIFDVYVQGERVLKDFNIVKEAQGVDKVIIRDFKAVVKDGSLEIHFHWAGKGTTAVPKRGTYGPLISAIDVESDFKPPSSSGSKRKKFIVAGAVVLPLFLILIIVSALWWKGCLGGRATKEQELLGLDLQTGIFTFRQIKAATNNFDPANKIGEGGFGSVYKGTLSDGTIIAVKQLSSKSKQGNREFLNEIGMISALQHPNLVRLYGCCVEGNQLLLVYEFMENNSLAHALFGTEESKLKLDWPTRQRICVGIAKGLAFLHEESALKIVHRDIKATNILLDGDLNLRFLILYHTSVFFFFFNLIVNHNSKHVANRGYMAPEYALYGYLTYKADVYSFGVVALEIVVGKSNMKYRPDENFVSLLDWIGVQVQKEEIVRMAKVALLCANSSPALRPTMSEVVSMLEGRTAVHEVVVGPSMYGDGLGFEGSRNKFDQISHDSSSKTQSSHGSDASLIASSSICAQELNTFNPNSQ
ncbi:hypothetical protein GH714_038055 [Hevea brasiliensis]|uniref:non-specific serine/threonine protein kinase n=1 Tax=Hevea brasiliensis TaxID=3981 RepID=A0A6A6LWC8_HEVBR|nr:hypothetical protein GH714_038055 [Hevea brasiliensis]